MISKEYSYRSMYEAIWESNKSNLKDTAFHYFGRKISYGHFFKQVKMAVNAFQSMGVHYGETVTIMSMHTPEAIVSLYALNAIGAVANMVYMTLAEEEIVKTIHITDSKLIMVLEPVLEKIIKVKSRINVPVVVLGVSDSMPCVTKILYSLKNKKNTNPFITWKDFLRCESEKFQNQGDVSSPAVIIYSSGTTGEPKGVVLSNNNLNMLAYQLVATGKDYKRQDTALFILPTFISFGIGMLHLGLMMGMDLHLCIVLNNDVIGKLYNKLKPTRFVTGNSLSEGLLAHVKGDMKNCTEIIGGGSAITSDFEDRFNEFLEKHNCPTKYMTGYGMSELASCTTLNLPKANKRQSLGIPLPQTNMKVISTETGEKLKYGQVGELLFSTPCMMLGYLKNKEATEKITEKDADGNIWLHTGDLGYIDEDGFAFFVGRIKRIFTVRDSNGVAYKLFPQRIEELFEGQDFVKSCAVIVKTDPQKMHVPIAFVELENKLQDSKRIVRELIELSVNALPTHIQPESIIPVECMPLTPSGKIDYQALELLLENLDNISN